MHCLVKHCPVEIIGSLRIGVIKTANFCAECLSLSRNRASADPKNSSSAGNIMKGRKILRQFQRVPLRNDIECHTNADTFGAFRKDRPGEKSVGDDLVALILEVVLGEPERVKTQVVGEHPHVENSFGGVPHRSVVIAAIGWCWQPRTSVVHLDAAEEENSSSHDDHCR